MKKKIYLICFMTMSASYIHAMQHPATIKQVEQRRAREQKKRAEQLRQLQQSLQKQQTAEMESRHISHQQIRVKTLEKKQLNIKQIKKFLHATKDLDKHIKQLKKTPYTPETKDKITEIMHTIEKQIAYSERFIQMTHGSVPEDYTKKLQYFIKNIKGEFEEAKTTLVMRKLFQQVRCKTCGIQSMAIVTCKQCQRAAYCSRDCLLQDWPKHEGECASNIKHVQDHTCSICKKFEPNIKMCAHCKQKRYCSRNCQKKDWPIHKKFCRIIANQ